MKFALPTRPEISRHVLRRSIAIYQYAFLHVFYLSLLLSIIVFLPRLLSLMIGQDIFAGLPVLSVERLWLVCLNIAGLIFFIAILWRIYCLIIHRHDSLREDFVVGLKKIPAIIVGAFVQYLIIAFIALFLSAFIYFVVLNQTLDLFNTNTLHNILAFLLLAFGTLLSIMVFLAFYFYLPIITVEKQNILLSIEKSIKLIWKNLGRVIYVQSVPWLTYLLCLVVVKYFINMDIHIYFFSLSRQTLLGVILQILMFAIFIPWIASTLFVQLRDLELRENPTNPIPH